MYTVRGNHFSDIFYEISYFIEDFIDEVGIGIVIALIAVPVFFVLIFSVAKYVLKSYAVFSLAKKFNKDNAVFAWIPFFHDHFCMYVLSDMTGKPYFSIHPEIDKILKLKDRKTGFYLYLACAFLLPVATGIIGSIAGFILGLIPFIGAVLSFLVSLVLGLIYSAVMVIFRSVYLRDVLDGLKKDRADNQRTAIIVCIVSHFVSIVFPIYLLTLLKYTPLEPCERYDENPQDNVQGGMSGNNPFGYSYNNSAGAPFGAFQNAPFGASQQTPDNAPYGKPGDGNNNL